MAGWLGNERLGCTAGTGGCAASVASVGGGGHSVYAGVGGVSGLGLDVASLVGSTPSTM